MGQMDVQTKPIWGIKVGSEMGDNPIHTGHLADCSGYTHIKKEM
jgi:hypothetical protein